MMTIDERVNDVQRKWFAPEGSSFDERCKERADFDAYLKDVLLAVARDQRHACAEAATEANPHPMWDFSKVHQAVMNASIK